MKKQNKINLILLKTSRVSLAWKGLSWGIANFWELEWRMWGLEQIEFSIRDAMVG